MAATADQWGSGLFDLHISLQFATGNRRADRADGADAAVSFTSIFAFHQTSQMEGVRMILNRRVTEAEVIAEFLKNEFYQKQYDKDRKEFEPIVLNPDLTDDAQNVGQIRIEDDKIGRAHV